MGWKYTRRLKKAHIRTSLYLSFFSLSLSLSVCVHRRRGEMDSKKNMLNAEVSLAPALVGSNRPKSSGTPYTSAGGGEVYFNPLDIWSLVWRYVRDEGVRKDHSDVSMVGPDLRSRPPQWMEEKNVAIDGTPLTEEERSVPNFWQTKYKKELDVGEAIQEVKRIRRMETTHNIIGSIAWVRRALGLADPLDEQLARERVEARYREMERNRDVGDDVERPQVGHKLGLVTPWKVLMESLETGQPVAKVANEYRQRVDFYGLDPFLDSPVSLIWFSTKCGIAIGIAQGATKALQAMNMDVQFLKASGVGILSILNMSVFANVVKWGGNCTLFSAAFCMGDRLAALAKRRVLPPHDAQQRSTSNYILGLAMSGATVGILPWWILSDVNFALRLSVSGAFVGGVLGLCVGSVIGRLVALNTACLEATNRELRRYEALMQRQRRWVTEEHEKQRSQARVWW